MKQKNMPIYLAIIISLVNDNLNRQEIVYAGANDGMLHAFSAETGKEVWAFVPPFIAAKLPTIFNVGLDGKVDGGKGGSNAIFGAMAGRYVKEFFDIERTTPMHEWHLANDALFEDVGQWKRAWYYPKNNETLNEAVNREVKATRDSIGILDASTLGKIDIKGRDVSRSEERRVGKECRSRWSPYH